MTDDTVTISVARLHELEQYEARFFAKTASDIERLREYDRTHPERSLERVKRYQAKNRDAYNARQRELKQLRKNAKAAAATATESPGSSFMTQP